MGERALPPLVLGVRACHPLGLTTLSPASWLDQAIVAGWRSALQTDTFSAMPILGGLLMVVTLLS